MNKESIALYAIEISMAYCNAADRDQVADHAGRGPRREIVATAITLEQRHGEFTDLTLNVCWCLGAYIAVKEHNVTPEIIDATHSYVAAMFSKDEPVEEDAFIQWLSSRSPIGLFPGVRERHSDFIGQSVVVFEVPLTTSPNITRAIAQTSAIKNSESFEGLIYAAPGKVIRIGPFDTLDKTAAALRDQVVYHTGSVDQENLVLSIVTPARCDEPVDEALMADPDCDQGTDYILKDSARSCWVQVDDFNVYIRRTGGEDSPNGVTVELSPVGDADNVLDSAMA